MRIRFTRFSNDSHRLEVSRPDGASESRTLETRSLLLHDLVHYAVESEARLERGFWGSLAAGARFDDLTGDDAKPPSPDLMLAETLVGPMQAVWNGRMGDDQYVAMARERAPFVDDAFVAAVRERLRHLWGHWRATPFHETMELSWPGWEDG